MPILRYENYKKKTFPVILGITKLFHIRCDSLVVCLSSLYILFRLFMLFDSLVQISYVVANYRIVVQWYFILSSWEHPGYETYTVFEGRRINRQPIQSQSDQQKLVQKLCFYHGTHYEPLFYRLHCMINRLLGSLFYSAGSRSSFRTLHHNLIELFMLIDPLVSFLQLV